MPFAHIPENTGETKFRKTEFIQLPEGTTIIRILDNEAYRTQTHYVNRVYVECLGEECPICQNNKKIIMENPEDFRKITGYHSKSERYVTNVLDRTPAKICPKCGKENKKVGLTFQPICECNESLMNVSDRPLNKVKILAKGKELFMQLNVLEDSVRTPEGEPVGLNNFDIALIVKGTERNTKIMTLPQAPAPLTVEVKEEDKFDTTKATFRLTVSEIQDLLHGVALKDILVARNASGKADAELEDEKVELSDDLKSQIDDLYK